MQIDRCVCVGVPFAQLQTVARAKGCTTVEALQKVAVFGTGCGLCKPYVREMLRTNVVSFDRIITDPPDDKD